MWIRLACLTLCNQTSLAAQEVKALEDLNSGYYREEEGRHLVQWELRVLAVRLQGMGFNDARRGVMGYYDLAREARLTLAALKKARKDVDGEEKGALNEEIELWESRLGELGIRVASALVEMEDLEGATRYLQSLPSSNNLQMQKALLWLCLGDVDAARTCVASTDDENGKKVVQGLACMADGEYEAAVKTWEELVDNGNGEEEVAMWKQNLGVCLLYCGRLDEVCSSSFCF